MGILGSGSVHYAGSQRQHVSSAEFTRLITLHSLCFLRFSGIHSVNLSIQSTLHCMQRGPSGPQEGNGAPVCQRCLQPGHWTYQCKNEAVYKSRPTRTQQLKNPKVWRSSMVIKLSTVLFFPIIMLFTCQPPPHRLHPPCRCRPDRGFSTHLRSRRT